MAENSLERWIAMKRNGPLIALSALFSILWAFSAWGYTINDTYWGGTVHNAPLHMAM